MGTVRSPRHQIRRLQRRLLHLEERIAGAPTLDRTYDRAEASALRFAIATIEAYYDLPETPPVVRRQKGTT